MFDSFKCINSIKMLDYIRYINSNTLKKQKSGDPSGQSQSFGKASGSSMTDKGKHPFNSLKSQVTQAHCV